jgi:N-acetylmuramoyl-L-alanine amidase
MRANPPPGTLLASEPMVRSETRYTIIRGDTISTIAQRYGISSRSLKSHNRLANDRIRIGQVILIPGGA